MAAITQKLLRSKKGTVLEIIMTPTFTTAVVLGIVLIGMLTRINAFGETKTFEKKFIATDLALVIDTLQASRGNAFVIFMQEFNFSIDISKNTVLVFEGAKDKDKTGGIYYFVEEANLSTNYKTFEPKDRAITSIILSKQGNEIAIGSRQTNPDFTPNLEAISCQKPQNLAMLNTIAIDYEHNQEADSAKEIAADIKGGLSSQIATLVEAQTVAEREKQAKDKEGIVSITLNRNANAQLETIKAYINENSQKKQESIFLACKILNSLSTKFRLAGASIVPVDLLHIAADDTRQILQPNETAAVPVAVVIELNIKKGGTLDKPKELASAIYNGIYAYQTA